MAGKTEHSFEHIFTNGFFSVESIENLNITRALNSSNLRRVFHNTVRLFFI